MYCAWKAKYRNSSLEELRRARRREHWRARSVLGVLLVTAMLGAGGIVFGLARAAQANITGAATSMPADVPADLKVRAPYSEAEVRIDPVADHSRDEVSVPSKTTPVEDAALSDALAPPTDPGFKVQTGAAPTVQEGRALMERLAAAGYPAYLFRAIVRDVEVFRVRVGPFDTLSAAEAMASQLQRDGFDGAWVVR
jgi:cell division septation protein DedD